MGAELDEERDAGMSQVVRSHAGEICAFRCGGEVSGAEVTLTAGPAGAVWPDERVTLSRKAQTTIVAKQARARRCSEAVAIANAMFVHANDYELQQFATRINQISGYRSGQHIAGRLVRLAKVERPTRMRAQYPSLDDGMIIEPYDW